MLTFGSLFAGIGGLDLGLERAGMKCLWQVEIDSYATRVLEKHWPDVQRYSDVRDCGRHNLQPVDLICGGFPCQDISNAGKRAGIDGERSGLWSEYVRIIRALRPRYVIVENVAALLVRGMGRVLGDLAESGYDAEWRVLSSKQFGADHRRDRVWLLAYPNGQGGQGLEPGRSPRVFGSGRWGSEANLRGEDWRTRPLFDSRGTSLLCRGTDGISKRMDRLKCLGNAVDPIIAEWIGRQILETNEVHQSH